MAYVKFEVDVKGPKEKKFKTSLSQLVKDFHGEDCRNMRADVRLSAAAHGVKMVVGAGSSHIWIHRQSEHSEGDIHASIRFAIITDTEL